MTWPRRLRAPVRLKLAALLFALVLLAGAALIALSQALLVRAVSGRVSRLVPPPGPVSRLVRIARAPTLLVLGPGKAVGVGVAKAPLNGPLTQRSLPKTVSELIGFRAKVEAGTVNVSIDQSVIALGMIAVLSALVAWYVAGRILAPLKAVTGAARRLSQETLHERIRMDGPQDEIKDLADTFDNMLRRLEAAFQSQRNFMANVSHELRTPLALQRTVVDVALADNAASATELRDALAEVAESVDEQEHLVEGLMLLAISERGLATREPIDLAAVLERALARVPRDHGAAGLDVRARLAPATVLGDGALLARMFGNLLENAARYNVPAGWVEVVMDVGGGLVRTTVRNSGAVVPPAQVEALFEPFRRLARERTGDGGAGLGLSIARAVSAAHGGTIGARALPEGGLEVVVALPLAEAAR